MSHWKAYASVREVPESELRGALVSALETLHYVAEALEVDGTGEEKILDAIQELKDEKKGAEDAADEAESREHAAEARLEEKLQAEGDTETGQLRKQVAKLQQELEDEKHQHDLAKERLAKVEPLLDAYSDTLAFARKFVTLAEGAGVKPRHVRPATRQARGQVKT
jgi:chromosome segregation ATPase